MPAVFGSHYRRSFEWIESSFFIVDDGEGIGDGLDLLFATVGQPYEEFGSAAEFLDGYDPNRKRALFEAVADGDMNKVIAFDLGICERTVEVHRANVMKKLGVRTLTGLIRIRLAADAMSLSD